MTLVSVEKIKKIIANGEDSYHQFKRMVDNEKSLAKEIVAFLNAQGGLLIVGVDDASHEIIGLSNEELGKLNQHISNVSSEHVIPSIHPISQIINVDDKRVLVVEIEEGQQKPYKTKSGGQYLIKTAADKRDLSIEELSRMLQESNRFHTEELAVRNADAENELDKVSFYSYFEKKQGKSVNEVLEENGWTLQQLLNNISCAKESQLTLLGLLHFGINPQKFRPQFTINAVSFIENEVSDTKFIAKENFGGNLSSQFQSALLFVKRHLDHLQKSDGFNGQAELEINEVALEEAIINALVHRDYSIQSSIKLFVFKNRVEIISPGKLTNSLSIEQIKLGNSIARNPLLSSFGSVILPYSGIGSGVKRILKHHPQTEFVNNKEGHQFIIKLGRGKK